MPSYPPDVTTSYSRLGVLFNNKGDYENAFKYHKDSLDIRKKFLPEDHLELIDIMLDTPFHLILSIARECELYVDLLKDAGWNIQESL